MRHRITSFRCVEAGHNMSSTNRERKTCNEVKIRHYLLPSGGRVLSLVHHGMSLHARTSQIQFNAARISEAFWAQAPVSFMDLNISLQRALSPLRWYNSAR